MGGGGEGLSWVHSDHKLSLKIIFEEKKKGGKQDQESSTFSNY